MVKRLILFCIFILCTNYFAPVLFGLSSKKLSYFGGVVVVDYKRSLESGEVKDIAILRFSEKGVYDLCLSLVFMEKGKWYEVPLIKTNIVFKKFPEEYTIKGPPNLSENKHLRLTITHNDKSESHDLIWP